MELKSITVTVRQLMDEDMWDKFCDIKGWSVWIVNEGLMDEDEEVCISGEELKRMGVKINCLP